MEGLNLLSNQTNYFTLEFSTFIISVAQILQKCFEILPDGQYLISVNPIDESSVQGVGCSQGNLLLLKSS